MSKQSKIGRKIRRSAAAQEIKTFQARPTPCSASMRRLAELFAPAVDRLLSRVDILHSRRDLPKGVPTDLTDRVQLPRR